MSILAGRLALLVLVPMVGAGVAYPMTTKLGGGNISLEVMSDFESNCWVSVQGDQGDDDDSYKKRLLTCFTKKDSDEVKFYFYDKNRGNSTLPKEVKEVKSSDSRNHTFTISFVNGESHETVSTPISTWDAIFSKGIGGGCKIESASTSSGEVKRLSCNGIHPQTLEKFTSN